MKITVVGCGNAFSRKNYNQCFMLEEMYNGSKRTMLIDFGSKVPQALNDQNIKFTDIDDIYISHLHADHIGGLEEMAFMRYDWSSRYTYWSHRKNGTSPRLLGNVHLIKDLWDKSLRGGLDSMEGFDSNLETFFEVMRIEPNAKFIWQGWTCSLIQQVHIMTGSVISSTFGLFMEQEGHKSVYFTTDSQHCSPRQVEIFYKKADIIFQDCECSGLLPSKKEVHFSSGVHTTYGQLAGWSSANSVVLPKEIRSKMILSHYQDFVSEGKDYLGNDFNWTAEAAMDGFYGFAYVGQILEV